jgi:hypothetical protein
MSFLFLHRLVNVEKKRGCRGNLFLIKREIVIVLLIEQQQIRN